MLGRSDSGRQMRDFVLALVAIVFNQIFENRARFGNGEGAIGDFRRFSQRMHCAQLRRCPARARAPLVTFDFVRHAKFFQQPEDALRARGFEIVNSNHGV